MEINNNNSGNNTQKFELPKRNSIDKFATATDRGTKIVKKNALDKNAFLKILTAELTNQDPFNTKDSTTFVAQLAQFSQVEQITNLNSTMTAYSAYSLVGKTVAFNRYDIYGKQYGGVVQNVYRNKDSITVHANVLENGSYVLKEFDIEDVSDVLNTYDQNFQVNNNMNFLLSSSLIGKEVEVTSEDGIYFANVNSVYKDGININLNVDIKGQYISGPMELNSGYCGEKVNFSGSYYGDKLSNLELRFNKEKDMYEFRILKDGEDEKNILWNQYEEEKMVNGMKFILPKEKPNHNVTWIAKLSAVPVGEKNVSSNNVLSIRNHGK